MTVFNSSSVQNPDNENRRDWSGEGIADFEIEVLSQRLTHQNLIAVFSRPDSLHLPPGMRDFDARNEALFAKRDRMIKISSEHLHRFAIDINEAREDW